MTAEFDDRPGESGMILVNVLLIVAIVAAVLAIMLTGEDGALQRSARLREAAEANAILRGGELSAITALRRDLVTRPESDSLSEPWSNIADADAKIERGTFAFVTSDAQAKFNINGLARGDILSRDRFARIVAAVGIDADRTDNIVGLLTLGGPIVDIAALGQAGLTDQELARLAPLVTALPVPTTINLNTTSEALIAIVLDNPASARALMSIRQRSGSLTSDALSVAKIVLPPGAGLTSSYFWARGRVTIGDTSQQLVSLMERRVRNDQPQVVAIARWRGAAAPLQAPPLP